MIARLLAGVTACLAVFLLATRSGLTALRFLARLSGLGLPRRLLPCLALASLLTGLRLAVAALFLA